LKVYANEEISGEQDEAKQERRRATIDIGEALNGLTVTSKGLEKGERVGAIDMKQRRVGSCDHSVVFQGQERI